MTQAAPGRLRGVLAVVLLVVLVLGVALSGVLLYRSDHLTDEPLSFSNSGSPVVDDSDVSRAKAVAEQYALRMDGLDSTDVAGYVKSVGELLTTKYRADFEKVQPLLEAAYGKQKFTWKGFVRSTAVAQIDRDSAEVLVVHDKLQTPETGDPQATAYRWIVTLRKVDGKWRVDDFQDPDDDAAAGAQ